MRVILRAAMALAVSIVVGNGALRADDAKPEFTIKQVMKTAHKDGLLKKITDGEGSKEDDEKLLALYKALSENKPPKGSEADWEKKTDTLVEAAQGVVDDKEGAIDQLKKAANCAACHKAHKPS